MRSIISVIAFFFIITTSLAQDANAPITIGTSHSIHSDALNEERALQVYTPPGYAESNLAYPVLYILDGQQYFLSGVSIQTAIRSPRAIPEMIVVGVNNDRRLRWQRFGEEKEKFSAFLMREVLPFVEANYRTSGDRVLFGWEAGAYFAGELVLEHPEVFNGAILSNGGYAEKEAVQGFSPAQPTYLYMANSRKDIYNIGETEAFHQILKENSPESLVWKYDLFNDEIHESLAHLAMYKGLKFYYHNFNSLAFESIEQFVEMGGLDYLTTYFKERARRFGGDTTIDNSTKDTLIWLAWNRDNFEYFSLFMTEFEDVLSTPRYASAYWQNRFGQFYLKHKDYANAIKYFKTGLSKYPNTRFEEQMKTGLYEAERMKD